ncbi:MAG: thiamine pyrophosphate-dependent dehydrogenase E1 component subunit alpha [Anaerolineae bacterium]
MMYTIRFFEQQVKLLYQQGQITGAVHLYIGQEAVAAGVGAALRRDDFITSTHRSHGHCLGKGGDLKLTMAELMGRATGYCHGCGGSMHLFSRDIGLLGGNGIVGGGLPIALGAAYSSLYRGTDQVTVSFFSDGASNQGTFHESLNMAALWKLPLVFLCENNLYAATTPASKTLALPDVAARAAGYGIPGVAVDGNDVEAVYEVAGAAVARARRGDGPSLIEAKTYRLEGHCMVLDCFRDPEELAAWKDRDPILAQETRLLQRQAVSEAGLSAMRQEVESAIDEAVAFAKASPFPTAADIGITGLPATAAVA